MSRSKAQVAAGLAAIAALGFILLVWAISYIPGLSPIRVGVKYNVDVDFIEKEKTTMVKTILAESDEISNMELLGDMIVMESVSTEDEDRLKNVLGRTENSYMSLINSSGDVVWETGEEGEYLFNAEIPVPGGLGKRGEVNIG